MTHDEADALTESVIPLREIPHYAGGQWLQFLEEYNRHAIRARSKVAAAFREKDAEIERLRDAMDEARILIGEYGQKDELHEAQRQSNRNKAWWILEGALTGRNPK